MYNTDTPELTIETRKLTIAKPPDTSKNTWLELDTTAAGLWEDIKIGEKGLCFNELKGSWYMNTDKTGYWALSQRSAIWDALSDIRGFDERT